MHAAIVQQAIAFVSSYYGLDNANVAAHVNAIRVGGWLVTVWIGTYLKQSVIVGRDGTVQRVVAVDQEMLGEITP